MAAAGRALAAVVAAVVAAVLFFAWEAEGIALELPQHGTKCVSEEIEAHSIVLGDYTVFFEQHTDDYPTISTKISSPYGKMLHEQRNVSHSQFSFTTTETGTYVACFWQESNPHNIKLSVNIDWRTGIAAKDWDSVAKKDKIEGVELEIQKLEYAVQLIYHNLQNLRTKEEKMREISERTNGRVASLSILSLGVCILASIAQLWNLKKFFRKKMLI